MLGDLLISLVQKSYTDVLINTGTIILNTNTEVESIKLSNGASLTISAGVK